MEANEKKEISPYEMHAAPCSHDQTGLIPRVLQRAPAVTGKFGAGLHTP
jgi:hypothetical protein